VSGLTWTYPTAALPDGAHSFTAKVRDAAGSSGAASGAYAVTVDTTVPMQTVAITGAADDAAPVLGNVPSGGATNDATLGLSGTLSAALVAGDVVDIYDGVALLGQATVSGLTWTYPTTALPDGAHSFTANVRDAAGNTGAASGAYAVTVDTTPPVAGSTPDLVAVSDLGTSSTDNITSLTTGLQFTGTGAEAGGSITLFDDVNSNGVVDAGELLGSTITAAAGAWTVSGVSLAAGVHANVKEIVTDATGNAGPSSAGLIVTIGNTAPTTASTSKNINGTYTMSLGDFNFSDVDGNSFAAVVVNSSTTGAGTLLYNGVVLTAGQIVTASDIVAGKLQLVNAARTFFLTTSVINYSVIDTDGLQSAATANLTLSLAAVSFTSQFDATGGSYFDKGGSDFQNFIETACALALSLGGHLATANTASEWTVMTAENSSGTAIVGLQQASSGAEPAGGWTWIDGTSLNTAITPWDVGSPDNAGLNEDIGVMTSGGTLIDRQDGSLASGFIVEYDSGEFTHTGTSDADNISYSGVIQGVTIDGKGGADFLTAGGGNDTFKVPDTLYGSVTGGAGFDTLEFTAAAVVTALALSNLSSIEAIRLGAGTQDITFDDFRVRLITGNTDSLYVTGDAADTVHVNGGVGTGASQWHLISTNNGLNTYVYFDATNSATTARLLIDAAITNVVV
jgi:hypothetical protein